MSQRCDSMAEEKQVLVRFVTKLPPELHVPQTEVVGLAAAAAAAGLRLLLLVGAQADLCAGAMDACRPYQLP